MPPARRASSTGPSIRPATLGHNPADYGKAVTFEGYGSARRRKSPPRTECEMEGVSRPVDLVLQELQAAREKLHFLEREASKILASERPVPPDNVRAGGAASSA